MGEPKVTLRPATTADFRPLLEMVNHPDSLAIKLRTRAAIDPATHGTWLARRLDADDCQIWMISVGDDDAGQVRLERAGDSAWEIDIFVRPAFRRSGTAAAAIRAAAHQLGQDHPDARLRARIKAGNAPSMALFASLGFHEQAEDHGARLFLANLGELT